MLHIKFGFDWPSGFRGDLVDDADTDDDNDGWTVDGRTPGAYLSYKLPCETSAQVS